MQGISKAFPGVIALDGVDLNVTEGECLALVGENGAGKSTLMSILGGVTAPDQGTLRWRGKAVTINDVRAAQRQGIAYIHQELMLAPNLDVAANIFLGREFVHPLTKKLDRKRMQEEARSHLARIGVTNIDPKTLTSTLTTGQRQMVEIAKALSMNAKLVIMDEPTSSLTLAEVEHLYRVIRELKNQDIAIIYISHRLDEIFAVTDRVLVLRDGKHVAEMKTQDTNHDEIIRAMVGRELKESYPKKNYTHGDVLLEVKGLVAEDVKGPNAFQVRRKEILCFAGLVGAGRTELMQVLFGVTPLQEGTMHLNGAEYRPRDTQSAIARGVFLAPEDRKLHGLILDMSIQHNVTLPSIKDYSKWKQIKPRKERDVSQKQVDRMRVRTPSLAQSVGNLSGGNQQKVVIGKWLARTPTLLILDEPTRGIDVGARAEIYDHIAELAASGLGIIIVSSDMEEVLGMSDRVAVMHEGKITGIIENKTDITEENIMLLATGGSLDA
jgi:ribose transport system ATP-binding protein